MKGWRLPLLRKPDPVLTNEEIDIIATLLEDHIVDTQQQISRARVSESVLRSRKWALDAQKKVNQVRESRRR